ncbi:MAG: RNA polymerase subunit sigma-70, partial [Gammaproteobacteria bacterium]|nr:RNA polymerase subunit sigma-70 [Gammaproteobacteria bacterium]
GGDEEFRLGALIPDESAEAPLESTASSALENEARELLGGLDPRESRILAMRYGIGMDSER